MRGLITLVALLGVSSLGTATAQETTVVTSASRVKPEWVTRSDLNTRVLLEADARFDPESAGRLGIPGLDDKIIALKPQFQKRHREATEQTITELERRLEQENDVCVRQDLEILIKSARSDIRGAEIRKKYFVQFYDANEIVYWGSSDLLDDQVPQERRVKALVRLRRYAGMF